MVFNGSEGVRESSHDVLLDFDVLSSPRRRGGLLPMGRKVFAMSGVVNHRVLTAALNDSPSRAALSGVINDSSVGVARRTPPVVRGSGPRKRARRGSVR